MTDSDGGVSHDGRNFTDEAHFSSGNDERGTPLDLIQPLKRAMDGFDLDPASGCEPEPIAPERYTKEDDGLARPWFGDVWVNPPYSDVEAWMQKAWQESQSPDVDSVMCLVPNRTSTRWFHDYATNADLYVVLDGRLNYVHTDGSAPFPSAIFVYGEIPDDAFNELANRGEVYGSLTDDGTEQKRLVTDGGEQLEGVVSRIPDDETHTATIYCPDCGWFKQIEQDGAAHPEHAPELSTADYLADGDARWHAAEFDEFHDETHRPMLFTESGVKRWEPEVTRFVE